MAINVTKYTWFIPHREPQIWTGTEETGKSEIVSKKEQRKEKERGKSERNPND